MGFTQLVSNLGPHGSNIWILVQSIVIQFFSVVDVDAQFVTFCSSFYGTLVFYTLVYASIFYITRHFFF